jgi:hypothetical protein
LTLLLLFLCLLQWRLLWQYWMQSCLHTAKGTRNSWSGT